MTFLCQHDVGPQCIPGGSEGNYLMFSSASSGSEPNNRKFSPCSVDFISAILHDMLSNQGSRENCLIESGGPICGNTIREGDEECDCGFTEDECRNKCCFSPSNPHKAKGCTLTPNVMCSPSAGSCCDKSCRFVNTTRSCAPESECRQVCLGGNCQGSICLQFGFVGCQGTGKDYTPQQMCLIHCRANATGSPCLDPCKEQSLLALCKRTMERGAACYDNLGYCDEYTRCRIIDEQGPLTRLHDLLLGTDTILRWLKTAHSGKRSEKAQRRPRDIQRNRDLGRLKTSKATASCGKSLGGVRVGGDCRGCSGEQLLECHDKGLLHRCPLLP
ncbi:hypothetical protein ISCGN_005490 [Ixodes scapularis]